MSLNARDISTKQALNILEKEGRFYFSYNSDLVQEEKKVNINLQNQSLENILNTILGDGYRYQVSDNHIIIKPSGAQGIVFSGRLVEAETGRPIAYASVYEKSVFVGTVTDIEGYFKLYVKQPLSKYELVITKLSYEDTVLYLQKTYTATEPIALKRSVTELDPITVNGIQGHWLARRLMGNKTKFNSLNLNNFFSRQPFQFSVLPGLSSKNRLKSQSINKFSFNLVGGYSAGIRGFELGTAFNIVQQDMRYAQISGLFNMVGGNVEGVQISSAYNYVNKGVSGVQISGVFNSVKEDVEGVQVSGVYNRARELKGVQVSSAVNWTQGNAKGLQLTGLLNRTKSMKGAQASGFANWNSATVDGFQASGVLNINDTLKGVQCTGLANYTHEQTNGVQIAGIANISRKKLNGVQVAGLLNYAKAVNGTQIGLINIADTTSGLSIGLLNIIVKGKHSFDYNAMEWQPYGVSYKSGTHNLYNIFQFGGNPHKGQQLLSFGYGTGTAAKLGKKSSLVQEALVYTIYAGNWNDQNIMARYQVVYQYRLHRMLHVYGGPAFSLLYHESNRTYAGFAVPFETAYPSFKAGNNVKGWLGWTLGFSLF